MIFSILTSSGCFPGCLIHAGCMCILLGRRSLPCPALQPQRQAQQLLPLLLLLQQQLILALMLLAHAWVGYVRQGLRLPAVHRRAVRRWWRSRCSCMQVVGMATHPAACTPR
jgi:hypothetical protein